MNKRSSLFRVVITLALSSCSLEQKIDLSESSAGNRSILNGVETSDYSHVVRIYTPHPQGGFSIGSGVLIRSNVVLTAAHVVKDYSPDTKVQTVIAGVTKDYTIASVDIHPYYNPGSESNVDLALVKLSTHLPITPASLVTAPLSSGAALRLIGYGRNGDSKEANEGLGTKRVSGAHLSAYAPILNQSSKGFLIVRSESGQGMACSGDSGGPALSLNGQVAGIFSLYVYHTGTGESECVSTFENYYVSVAEFRVWIDSKLPSTSNWPNRRFRYWH